jgi:hypothetical protein
MRWRTLLLASKIHEHVNLYGDVHDCEHEAAPDRHDESPESRVGVHLAISMRKDAARKHALRAVAAQ